MPPLADPGPRPSRSPTTPDVAPDGSPVAFYRRLPATGEPELIHALIQPGATILDLGCGAGRIAAPLAALGHPITGVDNGAAMIAALPSEVRGVVADAATVRLGQRFDVVLLASHLLNDPAVGASFVSTAATHLVAGGVLIAETYPPGWEPSDGVGRVTHLGDARIELLRARIDGDLVEASVRYGVDGMTWQQDFRARLITEPEIVRLLADNGLTFDRWLPRPGWFVARASAAANGTAKA